MPSKRETQRVRMWTPISETALGSKSRLNDKCNLNRRQRSLQVLDQGASGSLGGDDDRQLAAAVAVRLPARGAVVHAGQRRRGRRPADGRQARRRRQLRG